jgi:hypothetical protein
VGAAVLLLEDLLSSDEARIRANVIQNLSRVYFDMGDYGRVVELLSEKLDSDLGIEINEAEEFLDRLVYTLSLLALNRTHAAQRQLARIRYLAHVTGSDRATVLVSAIERVA